jgi:UDP-glucose 4-epimerase
MHKGVELMERHQLFEQPPFIPIFEDYADFKGCCVGITGHKGVLGTILHKRMLDNDIRTEPYDGDILDVKSLADWFAGNKFSRFFHFAAIVPVNVVENDALAAYEANVIGTYNICKHIIKTQSDCWLFLASSSHVYKMPDVEHSQPLSVDNMGGPENFYGASKLAAEQIARPLLKQYNISYCIGRIFSFSSVLQQEPYLVPTLIKKIEKMPDGGVLEVVNPDSVRDIMDAETVIDCILHLARNNFKGTINIGSGRGASIADIACHIAKLIGKNIVIQGATKTKPDFLVADIQELKKVVSR